MRSLSLSVSLLLLLATGAAPRIHATNNVGSLGVANRHFLAQPVFSQDPPAPRPPTQDPPAPRPPAQTPPLAQDQDETIRLSSRLVLVPVSVSDQLGHPVKDIKVEDVVIEEDGKPQQVVALGEPGQTPVDIALLFDVSGSVQRQFEFEQQAAVQFVKDVLRPDDSISVFSIGLTPKMVSPRTKVAADAIAGIMSIKAQEEPTAFIDAVNDAARYLDKTADQGSRRVLVVISDGEENYSKNTNERDTLRQLQKSDSLFYSINPTGPAIRLNEISIRGQNLMETMALQTGGKAFNPSRIEQLDSVFRQIATELQAQYLFGYYATNEKADGGFKRISVSVPKRPDLRIRVRQGHYSPNP